MFFDHFDRLTRCISVETYLQNWAKREKNTSLLVRGHAEHRQHGVHASPTALGRSRKGQPVYTAADRKFKAHFPIPLAQNGRLLVDSIPEGDPLRAAAEAAQAAGLLDAAVGRVCELRWAARQAQAAAGQLETLSPVIGALEGCAGQLKSMKGT